MFQSNEHLPDPESASKLVGLTWDCSPEFDASVDEAISFVDKNAFISFPNWISRTGAMVSFKVRQFIKKY